MVINGIKLFPRQQEIITDILSSKKRFIAIVASRQFSKSTILENLMMYRALNNFNIKLLYVTPTYSLSRIVMEKLYSNLVETGIIKTYNKSENIIEFTNNSTIYFRSATNPDTIRGLAVHYVFIDEAAFQEDQVWNTIRPTMNVLGKQCVMASTPRGKIGFFYQACMLGQSGNENYLYLYGHYSQNPFYQKFEVEDARKTLPENVFKQEYEAEFLDAGGSVFQNVKNCQTITKFIGFKSEGPYSIGIDLGRQQDWTVVTVLNKNNEVVEIYRDNKKDWITIIAAINAVIKKYPGSNVLCEVNSIGDVVYDLLRKSNPAIRPFYTTNESKNEIIEELILAFQTNKIFIPTQNLFPQLSQELNTYTFTYSPKTRRIIYNAMIGFNDDTIISLALALKAKYRSRQNFTVIR